MTECEQGDTMLLKRITDAVCVVALSSVYFSFPEAARANPNEGGLAPREHVDTHTNAQFEDVEVISEVRANEGVFQVLSVRSGEAGWLEITKTSPGSTQPTRLFQDTSLFTNDHNDGGASVPLEVKRKLALGYAKHVVAEEGGVEAFSRSLKDYEVFDVPLPSGLYRAALMELGVRFP